MRLLMQTIACLPLAVRAQRLAKGPLTVACATLVASRTPRIHQADVVRVLAYRATRLTGLIPGFANTCLVRSLVAATLLSDLDDVFLQVGFRVNHAGLQGADGHAWVTCAGRNVTDDQSAEGYEVVHTLGFSRAHGNTRGL